jgi:hypothetical protein
MTQLEIKKIEAELARVRAARLEMEVRLAELEEAMNRIKKDTDLHLTKERELESKLKIS